MTVRLDGIDLVIFDKDGTLIDFGPMWSGWAETLARSLEEATGRPIETPLYAMLGYDPVARIGPARRRARGDTDGAAARAVAAPSSRTPGWTARPRSERSTPPGTRRTRSSWPVR